MDSFHKIVYFVLRELFILIIFALCYIIRNEKKKIMSVEIRLEQSKFKNKKGAGKWYARTVSTGVATTDDLADSIQENTSFSRGDVRGLVIALIDEISYRLRQGETVALEGLGRFHLTVESEPVDNPDDFDIKKHIKNVKCRFVPTSTRNARTGKKNQTLAYGARVEWAEPEYDDEDDD